jgi:hypothetical protein
MVANFSTRFTVVLLVVAMVGGAMAVGALASSHTPEESTDQATTYVRIAHASAVAGAVDVYLDNESVVTDASFGDVTEYMELEAGTYNLSVTEAGDEEAVVFEDNVTLDPRTPTTVALGAEVTTAETAETDETTETENVTVAPLMFTDNPFPPGADDSAIRVVHLSSDAPTVDVTTDNGSVVLAENVSAGNASNYTNVPAGDYTVEIREATADDNGTVIATADVSLAGGEAYSAWAMGMIESADAANETAAGNETEEADNETATETETEEADNETSTGTETEEAGQAFTVELTQDATVSVHLPSDEETETPGEEETDTPTEEEESPTPTATETAGEEETDTPTEEESPTPTVTETPGDEEPTPPTVPEPP